MNPRSKLAKALAAILAATACLTIGGCGSSVANEIEAWAGVTQLVVLCEPLRTETFLVDLAKSKRQEEFEKIAAGQASSLR